MRKVRLRQVPLYFWQDVRLRHCRFAHHAHWLGSLQVLLSLAGRGDNPLAVISKAEGALLFLSTCRYSSQPVRVNRRARTLSSWRVASEDSKERMFCRGNGDLRSQWVFWMRTSSSSKF
jgi:hypothetical protein